ncbi:hypothetical protein LB505_006029 [Fusarium chuoi]|nr:hypothetical protein LB505_006029 [Fusarium chuoi]
MSFRLDGIIYRIGTDGGNMFMLKHLEDFEFYSSTSKGAIQGYGYEFHKISTMLKSATRTSVLPSRTPLITS